jgi:methanogenic corrinoid protein MtbC1
LAFDSARLTVSLRADWGNLGPVDFLGTRVVPLVEAVGQGWASGELGIHHEHFLSERLGDLLRTLRAPFDDRARGPLIVCATLPGEVHGLGLQMAALILSVAGCRILYLGTEVPAADIASLARDIDSAAVALSVSLTTRGPATTRQIEGLRRALPDRIGLVVGGAGAPRERAGLHTFQDFDTLHTWARQLAGSA